jgi:UDP-N-acetylmuramoylalanine--D-glutamate ligase
MQSEEIMNEKLIAFKESIKNKKVAVIGLGVSNTPLVEYLGKLGAKITVLDRSDRDVLKDKIDSLNDYDIDFSLGENYLSMLKGFNVIFKTPIVRPDIPEILEELKNGAVITSEMEIFFDLCPAEIFAVTGSDGKTTTTTIIYQLLKEAGYNCFLGGNIGTPLLNRIDEIQSDDKIVLELSSFQLMTMKKSPHVAVITNISPNHLDVHTSMEEYIDAKKNIYRYQNSDDLIVLNYDNSITHDLMSEVPGRAVYFSRIHEPESGAFLKGDVLCYKENGETFEILNRSDIQLRGNHNIENFLAAIAATRAYVGADTVKKAAQGLTGIEHRNEFVRELNGVKYYNDSIGSSPSRTMATLNAFDQRVILIAGGYDKKLPYDPLGDVLVEKTKHLILIGQTASQIEMALMRRLVGKYRGINIRITHCSTLRQAMDCASLSAKPGDVVLLSPASASFDMFKNFEERGEYFKKYVNEL